MSAVQHNGEWALEGQLVAVAEAAGARLRAETDEDADAASVAADALTRAATSAMAAGYSLTEIARAEARGKDTLRHTLRADALKLVERTGSRARDAQAEHYRAIARATRLGLPMREIAHAAHVTHGTVRAITHRLAAQTPEGDATEPQTDGQTLPEGQSDATEPQTVGQALSEGQSDATEHQTDGQTLPEGQSDATEHQTDGQTQSEGQSFTY